VSRDEVLRSLRVARERGRYLGRRGALATVFTEAAPTFTSRLQRLVGRPALYELKDTGPIRSTARELVSDVAGTEDDRLDEIEAEYDELRVRIDERMKQVQAAYPSYFPVEKQTSLLLYALTRIVQPERIVETGVADGLSTFVFLAALAKNGKGELHSIDVADNVGGLVDDRDRWHLHVCGVERVERTLAKLVREAPVDMFFHDADHRFLPQFCEYETFAQAAPRGALLVSDDVELSYAFITFCKRRGLRPAYLFDSRKVAAIVRLPS
jgi:predicted O-methyltransferase YrrM